MRSNEAWPSLVVDEWSDTRETLHLWLQVVGKVQMVSTPLLNHWWNITFVVSPRGLRTRTMFCQGRAFDAEFDFVADELVIAPPSMPSVCRCSRRAWQASTPGLGQR